MIVPYAAEVTFYFFINLISSVSIVCVNKLLFLHGFPFGTLLTLIHFLVTFISLFMAVKLGFMSSKPLNLRRVVPLCITYCGFVALTNLSLVYNSISVYQFLKVLTTPGVVLLEFFMYQKRISLFTFVSLVMIVCGVTIGTVSDTRSNLIGAIIGLSGVVITCLNQVWVGRKQTELNCGGLQLLLYQAPISALLLIPMVPLLDRGVLFMSCPRFSSAMLILLSAICAVLVNASIFLVIGKTSALTYNVWGLFKVIFLLLTDFMFFRAPWNRRTIFGVVMALAGVLMYTYERNGKEKQVTPPAKKVKLKILGKEEALAPALSMKEPSRSEKLI